MRNIVGADGNKISNINKLMNYCRKWKPKLKSSESVEVYNKAQRRGECYKI